MSKSIAFVIDGLAGGGAEKVVLTLAEGMVNHGHRVTIFSLRDVKAYPVPAGVNLIDVFDTDRGPGRKLFEISRRAKQLDAAIDRCFGNNQPDLVFSVLPKTDRIVRSSRRFQVKAWRCFHGAVGSTHLFGKQGLQRWIKQRQLFNTYDGCNWLEVSSGLGDDMHRCTGAQARRIATIPNPFDLEGIRQLAKEPCALDGTQFVVHVGRYHPVKRHDRLLEAFKLSGYPGKIILIGDGPAEERERISGLIQSLDLADRVIQLGFITNPYPYLRAAEALMLSSDFEGFGNVLVEALACGTPAVSTDCPYGPRSILVGELTSGLSPLTAAGLAATLNSVLHCPPIIGPQLMDRFTIDHIVGQYLSLNES